MCILNNPCAMCITSKIVSMLHFCTDRKIDKSFALKLEKVVKTHWPICRENRSKIHSKGIAPYSASHRKINIVHIFYLSAYLSRCTYLYFASNITMNAVWLLKSYVLWIAFEHVFIQFVYISNSLILHGLKLIYFVSWTKNLRTILRNANLY